MHDPTIAPADTAQIPDENVQIVPVDDDVSTESEATEAGTSEHTDQAYSDWQEAQEAEQNLDGASSDGQQRDAASAVRETREAFEAALRSEIEAIPDVEDVPGDDSQIRANAGSVIERYADDQDALEVLDGVIGGLEVEEARRPASERPDVVALLDEAREKSNPEEVMQTIADGLENLSNRDRAYLVTSPELAGLIREEVAPWVGAPYAGIEGRDLTRGRGTALAANEAAERLQTLTSNLPPELAYAVVSGNLGTIEKIAQLQPQYLGNQNAQGGDSFWRVADAVGAMGDTPAANQLRQDIAMMFVANGVDRGQGAPLAHALAESVQKGVSPGLALGIIEQLHANGNTQQAQEILQRVVGAGNSYTQDLQEYRNMQAELNALLARNEGLPQEAVDAAVQSWMDSQGPDWQARFQDLESGLIERAGMLSELFAGVSALPDQLSDSVDGSLKDLFNSEDVLAVLNIAASRDRTFMVGPEADSMMELADPARAAGAGAEMLRQLGNHAVQQQVSVIFADLEHGNPDSVGAAKAKLQSLGSRIEGFYGNDAGAYRSALSALDELVDLPANATVDQVEGVIRRLDSSLEGIEGFGQNTVSGVMLRSLGVAAGVLALSKYANHAVDDGAVHDHVATLGAASGLASSVISLLQRPGTVDISDAGILGGARSQLGPLSMANWGKALGVFSAVGDIAYMVNSISEGNNLEGALHGLAGMGTVALAVSSTPVGWVVGGSMIAMSIFGQARLADASNIQDANRASIDFLVGAGIERDVARILADTGETSGHLSVPVMPEILAAAEEGRLTGHEGRRMTPEQAIQALNSMSGDPAQLDALQIQVNQLRNRVR